MQIKSWHIALMSLPFGVLGAINEMYRSMHLAEKYSYSINPIDTFIIILISYIIYIGLPTLLLYIEKTRELGALACMMMGTYWIVMEFAAAYILGSYGVEAIGGLVLVIAGTYHLWKDV